ncbi:MAG TPA: hypothetical protein VMP67_12540 [Candidatus Limnocylindria bacterium]|nr:hypothetical protein [Candidatus Limnocylindria bacterium]
MAGSATPRHRIIVLPWIKGLMQRFVLPNWLAITLGPIIFAWRPLGARELAHELAHVLQWRQHGLLYPFRYWRASEKAQAAGLDRYRDNEFEVAARAAEESVIESPIA